MDKDVTPKGLFNDAPIVAKYTALLPHFLLAASRVIMTPKIAAIFLRSFKSIIDLSGEKSIVSIVFRNSWSWCQGVVKKLKRKKTSAMSELTAIKNLALGVIRFILLFGLVKQIFIMSL